MKHRLLLVAVTAAAVPLSACGESPLEPQRAGALETPAPRFTAISTTQPFTLKEVHPCTLEPLVFEGDIHLTTGETAGGGITVHTQMTRLKATSLTGAKYVAEHGVEHTTTAPPSGTFTDSKEVSVKMLRLGEDDTPLPADATGDDFIEHAIIHTVVKDGVPGVTVEKGFAECR